MITQHYRSYPSLAMDEVMAVFERTQHRSLEPISFGKGMSSFNPFDHIDLDSMDGQLGQHVGYGDMQGMKSLRQRICHYYQQQFDYDLSPERICITDGASGALTIALAMLLEAGDELILPASCYPAYHVMAQMFEAQCRLAPMRDANHLDVERLPQQISAKTRAILINSPSNPHGAVLQADELAALTDLGVPVIFDEVYQALSLTDDTIPSAIHFSDQHMIINSFSKSLAIAGFRVGYLIVPESQVELMVNVKAVLNMCTSLPSQLLANQLLPHWDLLVAKHRQMLQQNWAIFKETAQQLDLTLRSEPKAGFFALVDTNKVEQEAMQIALTLARHYGLSSTPGIDFQQQDNDFLRLNFACSAQQIEAGLARLAYYLQQDERQSAPKAHRLSTRLSQQQYKSLILTKPFLGATS